MNPTVFSSRWEVLCYLVWRVQLGFLRCFLGPFVDSLLSCLCVTLYKHVLAATSL